MRRIIYRPDGKVSVLIPVEKARRSWVANAKEISDIKVINVLKVKETKKKKEKEIKDILRDNEEAEALKKIELLLNLNLSPVPEPIIEFESDQDFYKRIFNKAILKDKYKGLPYDDVDDSEIPREFRDKWRGSKGNGIHIDHSIITIAEKRKAIENSIDEELLKGDSADPIKVIKLQRKLDKKDY